MNKDSQLLEKVISRLKSEMQAESEEIMRDREYRDKIKALWQKHSHGAPDYGALSVSRRWRLLCVTEEMIDHAFEMVWERFDLRTPEQKWVYACGIVKHMANNAIENAVGASE